ncbi:MAG: hypothetical protein HZB14_07925 [Actinobacteria bacterium]|nr:hypothetical protein [Actinomycetota bacterium]
MTTATGGPKQSFEELLPSDGLIAAGFRPGAAAELAAAPSLRLAAAELVREGYLLHYAGSRWYAFDDDDLALLAGDRLYAAGLAALAEARDVEAVAELARLIAGCAEAHAIGDPARADRLWAASLAMLARGSAADGAP